MDSSLLTTNNPSYISIKLPLTAPSPSHSHPSSTPSAYQTLQLNPVSCALITTLSKGIPSSKSATSTSPVPTLKPPFINAKQTIASLPLNMSDIPMHRLSLSSHPIADLYTPESAPTDMLETPLSMGVEVLPPMVHGDSSSFSGDADADAIEEVLGVEEADKTFASLTSQDIRQDPILSSLAKAQNPTMKSGTSARSVPVTAVFKARPAPAIRPESAGPRMTKSAALRQGLNWEAIRAEVKETAKAEEKEVAAGPTPGYKRAGLGLVVKSLSRPSIAPRPTKASQLRTGGPATGPEVKDRAAIAAANKAKAEQEREQRRKSIALPASLSAPSIAPRMNKSSALRTGQPIAGQPAAALVPSRPAPTARHARSYSQTPLSATSSAFNIANLPSTEGQPSSQSDKDVKAARRASMAAGLRSLAAPSIMPRLNKAALLRAPPAGKTVPAAPEKPVGVGAARPSMHKQSPATLTSGPTITSASATSSGPSVSRHARYSSIGPGPRPTKASLLRANLGAKVST